MNKDYFVREMAQGAGITQKQASLAFDALVESVTCALREHGHAKLGSLCSFSVVARKARTGRNPKTGVKVPIEAKNAVSIKPLQSLKDAI